VAALTANRVGGEGRVERRNRPLQTTILRARGRRGVYLNYTYSSAPTTAPALVEKEKFREYVVGRGGRGGVRARVGTQVFLNELHR